MTHYDDPWLDALAGRDAAPDRRETEAVRGYFAKRGEDDHAYPFDAAREIRMMAYLRSRNAFAVGRKPAARLAAGAWLARLFDWRPRFPSALGAAMASAAIMAIGGLMLLQGNPERDGMPPGVGVYRGNQAVAHVATADPSKTAAAISAVLGKRNVPHRAVSLASNQVRIEAKVSTGLAETEAALAAWKISIPENGVLVILVDPGNGGEPVR